MDDRATRNFIGIAYSKCRAAELTFIDDVHFVCVLMTLFGHRFFDDPRFADISGFLFDPAYQARVRRTKDMIEARTQQLWGTQETQAMSLDRLAQALAAIERGEPAEHLIPPPDLKQDRCSTWEPEALVPEFFEMRAQESIERLRIEGQHCQCTGFWTTWILGPEFDLNPQNRWWINKVSAFEGTAEQRYRRFCAWLRFLVKAGNSGDATAGGTI